MNSLVALGACSSFAVSCAAAALPSLGWHTFFEEPAMLLGVVLVGRALEERAKLQASSDMTAMQVVNPEDDDWVVKLVAAMTGSLTVSWCCRMVGKLPYMYQYAIC